MIQHLQGTHCTCPAEPAMPPEIDQLHIALCAATDRKVRTFQAFYQRKDSKAVMARREAKEAMEQANKAFNEAYTTWKQSEGVLLAQERNHSHGL